MNGLPYSKTLLVSALSRIFKQTSTSYKYLFCRAAFCLLAEGKTGSGTLQLDDIYVEMAATAWYPRVLFKLSFGRADQIGSILDGLAPNQGGHSGSSRPGRAQLRERLRQQADSIGLISKLTRYVPLRLLSPFFKDRLTGLPDQYRNKAIFDLCHQQFEHKKPLYKVNGANSGNLDSITFHDEWIEYVCFNLPILLAWIDKSWIDYLQARNPSVPAIPTKVSIPTERRPLNGARNFWREVIKTNPTRCLYTGVLLDPNDFALDHFLPWSFVAHNQAWNLSPVTPRANTLKSDRLPDPDIYLKGHAELHNTAIISLLENRATQRHRTLIDEYETGLGSSLEKLVSQEETFQAYRETCLPLISIAKRHGFDSKWHYRAHAG